MKEINEEIKLTLNLMQTDIDDGAHDELQSHLYSLLEIKRNELRQILVERSWAKPVTHDAKPLTAEELTAGGWWCARTGGNRGCLRRKKIDYVERLGVDGSYVFYEANSTGGAKQIHRIGDEFYWGEK